MRCLKSSSDLSKMELSAPGSLKSTKPRKERRRRKKTPIEVGEIGREADGAEVDVGGAAIVAMAEIADEIAAAVGIDDGIDLEVVTRTSRRENDISGIASVVALL